MIFWMVAATMTIGACLAILIPATRRPAGIVGGEDVEVYRDQLAELARDADRGLIGATEASEARGEIARRILKTGGVKASGNGRGSDGFARWIAAAAVIAVPLLSWSVYAAIGSPERGSQPLAARLDREPAKAPVDELLARAEAHLARNPDDGKGWDVLAPIYLRGARYEQAASAYRNAIRLNGADATRETGLGEAIAGRDGGLIELDAAAAFERALRHDPSAVKPRFFLAAAKAQGGDVTAAIGEWRAMLADQPENAQWRGSIERAIAQAESALAQAPVGPHEGPSADDIEAASAMGEEDRSAMIETMVAGLDERLRANPDDVKGWKRLIRSYLVLGRTDDAREALRRGEAAVGTEAGLSAFAAASGLSESR